MYPRPSVALSPRRCLVVVDRAAPWKDQCVEALEQVPQLDVTVLASSQIDASVQDPRPDVIVDLEGALCESNHRSVPLGVWALRTRHRGRVDRTSPWREFLDGAVTFDVALTTRDQTGVVRTLRSGSFKLSLDAKRLDDVLSICAQWPSWALEELDSVPQAIEARPPWTMREHANLRTRLSAPLRASRKLIRDAIDRWLADFEWNIGILENTTPDQLLDSDYRPTIRWMQWDHDADGHADPMLATIDGKQYVLCESVDRRSNFGRIEAFEVSGSAARDLRCILSGRSHLSYPYIFKHRGDYYCVPEMSQNNAVVLYKATAFPYEWMRVATLIDRFDACDSTVFRYGGLWWLFCTAQSQDPNVQLFAFYADDLRGPWKPHARNPIKTDIASARPAGTPFRHAGQLYRPAQDSSQTYGGAICLNRIVKLSPTQFEEGRETTVTPKDFGTYTAGTHTLSYSGTTCVLDAKRRRLSLKWLGGLTGRASPRSYDRVLAHG